MQSKLIVFTFLLISFTLLFGCTSPNTNISSETAKPVIYVTIVSHNEDSSPRYDYLNTEAGYLKVRDQLLKMAKIVKDNNAKWSYGPEWRFLEAALKYEKGDVLKNTNNKNILRYFSEDLGFEIAPHSHESGEYSYADVAYLIEQLGVKPANVVSGFIAFPAETAEWSRFNDPILGEKYDYTWDVGTIWGAGSAGHVGDEQKKSGVWKPKSESDFFTNDTTSNLINIGTCNDIDSLVDEIYLSKTAPADKMYTAVIFFADDWLLVPEKFLAYQAQIEQMNDYAKNGYVKWATFGEISDTWENEYNSDPNIFDCASGTSSSTPVKQQDIPSQQGKCGDGTCAPIERSKGVCPEDCPS
ncbi:MAG: hypothetical protein AABW59_03775 [archaeon]